MKQVSYVYPNVSEIAQRGGLLERWQLAKEAKCEYTEVPADFIKNSNEMQRTSLPLFSFLDRKSVEALYRRDRPVPLEVKYILHTEPSLPRDDGYGVVCQTPLKWYDRAWVDRFIDTSISISRFSLRCLTVSTGRFCLTSSTWLSKFCAVLHNFGRL